MRVLFCTDGSKISFDAIKNFAAWVSDATVDAICVIDWSFLPEEVNIEEANFTKSCAGIADNILNYACETITNTGLTFGEKIKHCGSTVDSIIEEIDKNVYDLVIMGSNGKKGLRRWLGSVSREVITGADISAYISRKENLSQRILFTTDGTKEAKDAAEFIAENFDLSKKSIYICMINEDPDLLFLEGTLDAHWLLSIEEQQNIYAARAVKDIQTMLEDKGLQVLGTDILTGTPAQDILSIAEKQNIDLIVMGDKRQSKMKKFLLGAVSKRVLENAESDVIVIRS